MTWENLSNMELMNMANVFMVCAIVGGGLFLLRSIMMVIGLGGDDGEDVGAADSADASVAALKLVSIHGLTAFLLMFGVVGYLILYNDPEAVWVAGISATVAGFVTMGIIAKIFQSSQKLQSDGTIYPKDIIGTEGSVYLGIRPGEIGKVQLTARDALKVFDARAKDAAAEIKTGARVKVVDVADVLVVESEVGSRKS